MTRISRCVMGALLLVMTHIPVQLLGEDLIRVVTTTPDLADFARQVGGDRVTVTSLTRGSEDFHKVRPRPRLLNAIYRADLLIQVGLDLEHSWLPQLMKAANNKRIRPGTPGFINVSAGIDVLDVPVASTRKSGPDLHVKGNPHYNLSPLVAREILNNIVQGFCRYDSKNSDIYKQNAQAYLDKLNQKISEWQQRMQPFEGAAFIEYHETWSYFARDFDLRIVARIEAKPGVTPQPAYLVSVVDTARAENVGLIVARPANLDLAKKIESNCSARALVLSHSSSATGELMGYIPFMDHVVTVFEENLHRVNR